MKAKGDCFKVALTAMLKRGPAYDALESLGLFHKARVIHALVTGQGKLAGKRFGHAWIEAGGLAFDFSNGLRVIADARRYREIGRVGECWSYAREEAMILALRHKHYGPWEGMPEL